VFQAVPIAEAHFLEAEGICGEIIGMGELGGDFRGLRIRQSEREELGGKVPTMVGKDFITGGLVVGAALDIPESGARAIVWGGGGLSEKGEGAVAKGITGGI
jgi:hypothetical protein